jgi:maltose alpha-D-glucosyltransferase/alpha-amylase
VDAAIAEGWAHGVLEQLDDACAKLRAATVTDEATKALADRLLARRDQLAAAAHRLALEGVGALRTRVHGDFHLGQVLVVQHDAYLIDFEGEPARPMEQRRAKGSPLRDVAGVLRSFDYAAAAAAPGRSAASPQVEERRIALLERFRARASAAFLEAYRDVLETAEHPWVSRGVQADLLDLFLIEKAAYEVRYEAANRPTWLAIPLRGLEAIAARVCGEQPA